MELTLSDLNEQLGEFLAELNSKPSRNQIALSRRDSYVQGCNRRGGIRQCPQDALGTLAKECRRTLDSSGIFRLGNREYEVPRLHSCQVIVRHALDDSERVIVEHPQTGERYDARPWQASGYGDFHADPGFERAELPIDKARAAGAEVAIRQPIFSPGAEPVPSNVRAFPARSQPAEPLSDPLDAGRHTDLPAAMAHFCALYPYPLSPRNRELIEARFLADGLRKSTVSEVAAALTHLAKGEAHTVT